MSIQWQTHLVIGFSYHAIKQCVQNPDCTALCVSSSFPIIYTEMELLSHVETVQLFEKVPDCFPNSPHYNQRSHYQLFSSTVCVLCVWHYITSRVWSVWPWWLMTSIIFIHLWSFVSISCGGKNGLHVFCLLCCFSEKQTLIVHNDLKLIILLSLPPKCWGFRPGPSHLAGYNPFLLSLTDFYTVWR